jgi:hypothetical protein
MFFFAFILLLSSSTPLECYKKFDSYIKINEKKMRNKSIEFLLAIQELVSRERFASNISKSYNLAFCFLVEAASSANLSSLVKKKKCRKDREQNEQLTAKVKLTFKLDFLLNKLL